MGDLLTDYFNQYKENIKKIVHVGAHLGQEVDFYLKYNPEKIYLFEPNKKIFNDLERNFNKYKNIHFYNFGLGSTNKKEQFFISNENMGESSSFLKPKKHEIVKPEITFTKSKMMLEIKKFDSLDINNIDFLNIDTQGYELEVLKGFQEQLKNILFIHCEINRDFVYENNALVKDIDLFLEKNDFIRIKTIWGKYNEPYGNALYLKKEFISYSKYFIVKIYNKFQYTNIFYFLRIFTNFSRLKFYIKKFINLI